MCFEKEKQQGMGAEVSPIIEGMRRQANYSKRVLLGRQPKGGIHIFL